MAEVTVKAYSRRGIKGKTIQVRGYTRRVGRKGIRSPKRTKEEPGEELAKKIAETPQKSFERVARLADTVPKKYWQELYGHYYPFKQNNKTTQKQHTSAAKQVSKKKCKDIFDKIEDKVAAFVEKYSGKKYKR